MAEKRTRFQTYLYDDTDGDIIDFWESLRRTDKRMVLCSAIRMYMNHTGYYQRSNGSLTPQTGASQRDDDNGDDESAENDEKIRESMMGFAQGFGDDD